MLGTKLKRKKNPESTVRFLSNTKRNYFTDYILLIFVCDGNKTTETNENNQKIRTKKYVSGIDCVAKPDIQAANIEIIFIKSNKYQFRMKISSWNAIVCDFEQWDVVAFNGACNEWMALRKCVLHGHEIRFRRLAYNDVSYCERRR